MLLPCQKRIPFAVSLLMALVSLKRNFDELELDRLTTPLKAGQLVKVAPVGRVFEVVEDGKVVHGERWIALRNLTDNTIWHLREAEAFRLTPTSAGKPKPHKGQGLGAWEPAPVDELLGIRTSGNLGIVPNRVVLVAPRSQTAELAETSLISGSDCGPTAARELITWGRIAKNGQIVREGGLREPMVAVTHSVSYLGQLARRSGAEGKFVIVDGVRGFTRDLQAFDAAASAHRVLVLGDHGDVGDADVLKQRGCEVWAPNADAILMGTPADRSHCSWPSETLTQVQNCQELTLEKCPARSPSIERFHTTIRDLEQSHTSSSEEGQRLQRIAWRLLLAASEWVRQPVPAAREFFQRTTDELAKGLSRDRVWLSSDVLAGFRKVLSNARDVIRQSDTDKGDLLLEFARRHATAVVVVRSAPGAARIRRFLEESDLDRRVDQISGVSEDLTDCMVLPAWPGRIRLAPLVSKYLAPRIAILCYPFEGEWLEAYQARWLREWTRYLRSPEELRVITGVPGWPESVPPEASTTPQDGAVDPISEILARRRKGGSAGSVPKEDVREAYYVGFHGAPYSFLTEGHKVPVLTELVLSGHGSNDRVPLRPVRRLRIGDFLLFRDQGNQDILALIAELELGTDVYKALRKLADLWRPALAAVGSDPAAVWRKLRKEGLRRSRATVRSWLSNDGPIGPRSESDLAVIARAAGDEELDARLGDVSAAIREIWSAHVSAGFTLSRLLLAELPSHVSELDEEAKRIEFTFGRGWIVCVEEVSEAPEDRPYWEVNRLLFEDEE